ERLQLINLDGPQHTAKLITEWLKDNRVSVLERPDLIRAEKATNLTQLHQFCPEDGEKTPASYCEELVKFLLIKSFK
uniref:Uncharacterized protein n=1 Tax=Kryptolebias marmoratus TaxID=37003 RepID=A0A3Q3B350_KRYMA